MKTLVKLFSAGSGLCAAVLFVISAVTLIGGGELSNLLGYTISFSICLFGGLVGLTY